MFEWKALFRKRKQGNPEPQEKKTAAEPVEEIPAGPAPKKQDGGSRLSDEEILAILAEKSLEYLREQARKGPFYVTFDVPGKDHQAQLVVTAGEGGASWRFSVGVVRQGSDKLYSHCLCRGEGREGQEKVLAYLARPEMPTEAIASVKELSSLVDRDD